jgi:PAS domain S-box-containing protein
MTVRASLFSLGADAPPGFEVVTPPGPADLRSVPFALYAGSLAEALGFLGDRAAKLAGILVVPSPEPAWSQLGPSLYHLGVTAAALPSVHETVRGHLALLASCRDAADRARLVELELGRAEEERRRLAADFSRSKKTLLAEISDRTQAENSLRETTERYRLLFENATDAIFILQEGRIRFPNQRLSDISGHTREELSDRHFTEFIHPEDRAMVLERHTRRLDGEPVTGRYGFRIVAKGGGIRRIEVGAVRIEWEGRPATLNFLHDVTRQKALEEDLLHARKLEAVGTLAGGIAHDFNNLLQVILGYATLLQRRSPPESPARESVEPIIDAAVRGSDLVGRLLTFSRRKPPEVRTLDLNEAVARIVALIERVIPKMVRVELSLGEGLPPVPCDPTQLEQLVMNLGTNARDAMPAGGTLSISTRAVGESPGEVPPPTGLGPGPWVALSVADSGEGMEAATMERMFDPFFTTKEVGSGTGLGLSTVYGIVREHGGIIRCESRPGDGTRFDIFLPAAAAGAPTPAREPEPAPDPLRGGAERILLVDDEKALRAFGKTMLEALGYRVACAATGEEALEACSTAGEPFDVVVLDLGMPGMGGRECLKRLGALQAPPRVLVVSGYAGENGVEELLSAGAGGFLGKPYLPDDLARSVRTLLDGGPSRRLDEITPTQRGE